MPAAAPRPDAGPPTPRDPEPATGGRRPDAGSAERAARLTEAHDRLRRRLDEVTGQRDALIAERHAVLRLLDEMRSALAAATAGTDFETMPSLEPVMPSPATSSAGAMLPIIIAGTGRSGTTAVAKLLFQHPEVAGIDVELRFHASARYGLPALLAGVIGVDEFVDLLRSHWFRRASPERAEAGLHRFMSNERFDDAVAAFMATWPTNPEQACRDLLDAPFLALAADSPPRAWVEHTPANLFVADMLASFLPDMRLVHVFRDGRDVASSVVRRTWGPEDLIKGIRWWGHRLVRGHQRVRRVPAAHHVRIERLAITYRTESLEALMTFIGIEPDARVLDYFATEIDPAAVRRGRWRADVSGAAAEQVDATYRGVLERLRRLGVPVDELWDDAPDLDEERIEQQVLLQELHELRIDNRLLRKENLELGTIAAAGELGEVRQSALAKLRRVLRASRAGDHTP